MSSRSGAEGSAVVRAFALLGQPPQAHESLVPHRGMKACNCSRLPRRPSPLRQYFAPALKSDLKTLFTTIVVRINHDNLVRYSQSLRRIFHLFAPVGNSSPPASGPAHPRPRWSPTHLGLTPQTGAKSAADSANSAFLWKTCQAPLLWKTPQPKQNEGKINFQNLGVNYSNLPYWYQT